MTGYTVSSHGNYKCTFCKNPKAYKSHKGITDHLESNHEVEYKLAQKDAEIERLKNQKPRVEYKERVVYRDPPADKNPDPKYWHHGIFCTACRIAYRSVGIPFGQTIESTPHSNCGTRSLVPVDEVVY